MLETAKGKTQVTFRRSVLDKYAPEVRLLTYQTEELRALLAPVVSHIDVAADLPATLSELERELASEEG